MFLSSTWSYWVDYGGPTLYDGFGMSLKDLAPVFDGSDEPQVRDRTERLHGILVAARMGLETL